MKINKYIFLLLLFIGFLVIGNGLAYLVSILFDTPLFVISLQEAAETPKDIMVVKSIIGINHFIGFTLTSVVYVWWFKKKQLAEFFHLKHLPKLNIILGCIALLIFSYPLIGYTTMLGEWIDLPDWAISMDENAMNQMMNILEMNSPISFIINLLIIAVLPGLGEELLFRGIIQKELQKTRSAHFAIWITAIIFSAVHMQIEGFLPKLILGLMFGYIYFYTKNLWYPILLHLFNNGLQVVMLYIAGGKIDLENMEEPEVHWALALLSFVIIIAIYKWIDTQYHNRLVHQENENIT